MSFQSYKARIEAMRKTKEQLEQKQLEMLLQLQQDKESNSNKKGRSK